MYFMNITIFTDNFVQIFFKAVLHFYTKGLSFCNEVLLNKRELYYQGPYCLKFVWTVLNMSDNATAEDLT